MVTYRIERLNKEFLRLIAEILANQTKNDLVKDAILTHVDCSRDLGHAKVYFTLFDESRRGDVTEALHATKGVVRGLLGRAMHIRQIPELLFLYDDSEKQARAIDALIDKVSKEEREKRKTESDVINPVSENETDDQER